MSLLNDQKKIILDALDGGAAKTADYLEKLTRKSWKCTVSSLHQDFTLSLVSASPEASVECWSAYVPLQGQSSFGVQLLIDPKSVSTISEAFADVYGAMKKNKELQPIDMVREISNIVAHGFCGELARFSGELLILSIPEVSKGRRGRLLEEGLKRVQGVDLIVISHIVMLSSAYFSIRCELYFYAASEFLKTLLPRPEKQQQ